MERDGVKLEVIELQLSSEKGLSIDVTVDTFRWRLKSRLLVQRQSSWFSNRRRRPTSQNVDAVTTDQRLVSIGA